MLVLNTSVGGSPRAGPIAFGILAVWAAELDHEILDYSMEMQAVIKFVLNQPDEISCGDRHFVFKYLGLELAQCGIKNHDRICHWCYSPKGGDGD